MRKQIKQRNMLINALDKCGATDDQRRMTMILWSLTGFENAMKFVVHIGKANKRARRA